MSLIFKEKGHQYSSIDPNEDIKWTSVTSLVGMFKEPFNPDQAVKSSKNKKSKWYNKNPEKIKEIWAKENKRATDLGTYYHNQREKDLMDCESIDKEGETLPVIPPKIQDDIKYAPNQKLIPGVYPEHFVYLKSAKVCGQADYVAVVNNRVHITDYKTNKEIKLRSYKNWEGMHKMLKAPISDIEDCHLQHYALQLSIYMYIILKHNPRLKPGNMVIQHVVFEKIRDDENGYPVTLYNDIGDPVIKDIVKYEVPYMKEHVIRMINWLKNA
jgi:ATP-dependent exoDNAse (exonuclease V) beta subunit